MKKYYGNVCMNCAKFKPGKDQGPGTCSKCGGRTEYIEEKGSTGKFIGLAVLMSIFMLLILGSIISSVFGAYLCAIPLALIAVVLAIIGLVIQMSDKKAVMNRVLNR